MSTRLQRREPHRLIRIREVLCKVGVSQCIWYEAVKEGRAPSPVKREWQPLGDAAKRVVAKLKPQSVP